MTEDGRGQGSQADVTVAGVTAHGRGHASAPDTELVKALRRGDEAAFMRLVETYYPPLLRLARMYVGTREAAEEVVQETWIGVLKGLDRFEGRSSLKTWIFQILVNTAKTRAAREGRTVPFSSLANAELEAEEPAVEPDRFQPPGGPYAGGWVSFPQRWEELPEQRLLSQETYAKIGEAIQELPPNQRAVIVLRDVEGWPTDEVCNILGVTETNQRVLLHRARARVRQALERYFEGSRWSS